DSRLRNDASGHTNDLVTTLSDSFTVFDGVSTIITLPGHVKWRKNCSTTFGAEFPAVRDSKPGSGLPWTAIVGLSTTTDPFQSLGPGQSVEFAVAFIAAENADSLIAAWQSARLAYLGTRLNVLPDSTQDPTWLTGETGIQGHEVCYTPPEGVEFNYDPNCT